MLRKKHGKNHQKRGSTSAGMTDGQISKTDLSRFKMGGQLSPEYPLKSQAIDAMDFERAANYRDIQKILLGVNAQTPMNEVLTAL